MSDKKQCFVTQLDNGSGLRVFPMDKVQKMLDELVSHTGELLPASKVVAGKIIDNNLECFSGTYLKSVQLIGTKTRAHVYLGEYE